MGGFYGPVNIDPRARPRLKDRVQDDPVTREQPQIGPTEDVFQATPPQVDVATPPQPSLKERVLGGLQGVSGGGRAGLAGRVARGAAEGLLGPTQRQDIAAERLGSQRIAGETGLEAQRERFALPEQQARIAQQEAGTEQSRLATKILQRRLDLMSGGAQSSLQDLTDDENAVLQSAYATGDPKVIEQAVSRIYNRRSVEGMVGPGTNVYDQNAPGGVSRQFMTRGGAPLPDATVRGAVVPGTLPRTETGTQLVPTEGGGMAAVPKTSTTAPVLPGGARGGGGGGAGVARPVMGPGGEPLQPRLPAQEERAQQTAILAVSQLPYVAQEMKAIRDKLGPLQGRVMEIRRVIGDTDPNYVKIREDTDAAVGAFSVIHFGARGNWQWLQDFKGNVDAGALTYPDLVAGWQVLERWLRAYQTYGTQRPVDEASGVNAPGVAGARR